MGEAKRRGTREERIAQSQEKIRVFHEESAGRRLEQQEREKKWLAEENEKRVAEGRPILVPRQKRLSPLLAMALIGSMGWPTNGPRIKNEGR